MAFGTIQLFNCFRHYFHSSGYSCPIISKKTYKFYAGYFVQFTPVQKWSVLVLLGVYCLSLHQIWLIDFGRIYWEKVVLKMIRKLPLCFHSFMRLCHHFDWEALLVDVSAILFGRNDQILPKPAIKWSFWTLPIIISLRKWMSKKCVLFE